jgi:hypothetical protein
MIASGGLASIVGRVNILSSFEVFTCTVRYNRLTSKQDFHPVLR